ncbi:CRISPR-associated endonuclease Cas1 [Salmonella enterica subsp. enterica serovar Hillingdon]|nr:CRISPR-associated endonuclease Cas1 [Salmonella enterica subsp. enterica serovar Hillingdon]ECG2578874.1 CRISPR-associated endonuclease Cas1 [Salmonella enterica subsp. enterica]EDR0865928.1 CRISPR-associated endonuclease Cas1 [Salmonella enterica subsp. enterica serovar Hillingdon]EDR6330869.1 CRISPR-associated endonuclease Cas1 [Salmonella enterica subsp. enterica serovar Hillingdon]HAF5935107.1 CRISPR-associated endonuclease Cas1 [Salmonella enterica]
MNIIWLKNSTIDSTGNGLIEIFPSALIRPVIARAGDLIIGQRCSLSGRAVSWAYKSGVRLFITSNGAAKLQAWLPVDASGDNAARQIVASNTPRVIDEVARWMLARRFGKISHPADGINVVRGYEGAQVRQIYKKLAAEYGIEWDGRKTTGKWDSLTPINKTISICNSALYGLTEIAIIHAGYSPYFGFMHGHSGKALVYDIADMIKFEHVTPIAFRIVADGRPNPEWRARAACARLFRRCSLLRELVTLTEETMNVALTSLATKPPRRRRKNLPGYMAKN